jgi:hypothetical protein
MADEIIDGGTASSDFSTTDGGIDYRLPLGKVRLLITDVAPDPADWLFTDDQLDAFLELNDGSVLRTAAQALVVIATSENLLGKKIRTQSGTSTDGPAVSAELRALAGTYEARADTADAAAAEGFFDVVPFGSYCKPEGAEWRL